MTNLQCSRFVLPTSPHLPAQQLSQLVTVMVRSACACIQMFLLIVTTPPQLSQLVTGMVSSACASIQLFP